MTEETATVCYSFKFDMHYFNCRRNQRLEDTSYIYIKHSNILFSTTHFVYIVQGLNINTCRRGSNKMRVSYWPHIAIISLSEI